MKNYDKNLVKNFTVYDENKNYIQYLCKLKKDLDNNQIEQFFTNLKNDNMPDEMIVFFEDQLNSNVIDFKEYFNILSKKDIPTEILLNHTTEFLDMFNFGNKRFKANTTFALDYICALRCKFGNITKDRRLVKEYYSVEYNTNIINFLNYNIEKNYKENLKNKKQKIKTI